MTDSQDVLDRICKLYEALGEPIYDTASKEVITTNGKAQNAVSLLDLWCELGDGMSFNANAQQAVFRSTASVRAFREAAPSWAAESCGPKRRVMIRLNKEALP